MITAQLAPAVEAVRLSLHVLAATIWVGGQLTVAGLVPTARQLSPDAPRQIARAFARLSWPAYAVLIGTGIWNVAAVGQGQPTDWNTVLGVKIGVVTLAGIAAWLHSHARQRSQLAIWGAVTAAASIAALVLGVLLAG
jgi:putative copper export protein